MFKKGDLVGLMIVNDWEEDVLSDSRGVVLRSNGPESIALVYWIKMVSIGGRLVES